MKKLIALIGAVATAFGLYAASTPYAVSFEAKDPGVSEGVFTPVNGWTWGSSDALTLGVYAGDAYTYGTGALARRDDKFIDTDNLNYLKLETGTNALSRAVEGNLFLDQLVKFTGFEEYQTNVVAGTKIAVWMSGIEQEGTPAVPGNGEPEFIDDLDKPLGEGGYEQKPNPDYFAGTPASDDYIAGETNLYITCAKVVGGKVEPVALKIAGNYKLDTWYRLTIKSLGSIYEADPTDAVRAGFIVYIDGQQVAAVGDEAKSLIQYQTEMTSEAQGFMADGALFPAIDTTDATFATVGYQGIGAIDDIILDDQGPAFAQAIPVQIIFPGTEGNPSIEVDYIDVGGVHMTYPCAVPAGTLITVYFKAVDGKKIMSDLQPKQLTVKAGNSTIDVSDVVVEDVVAKKNGTVDLAESELYTVLGALVEKDTVETISTCNVTNGEAAILYSFTPNTTITATAAGWDVFVGNYDMDDGEGGTIPAPGMLTVSDDITANFTMNVGVEDEAQSWVIFSGTAINGQLAITNGLAMTGAAVTVGDGALLKAATFTPDAAITLVGTGKLVTQTDLASAGMGGMIVDGDGNAVVPTANDPEAGWYTYALAIEQPAFVPSATVADDLATAIAYLKNNYYNKYKNGDKVDAPDASFVKVGTLASDVTGTVSIGGTAANADEKFSLSIGNNAFLESAKFKIVGREVSVAAVILAIEQVKVTANAKDYQIDSAKSGQLALESFAAVAPTTIAGEGTNFTIVRGDDKPLVKFFFTDKVTQYFVTKKTFIGKDKVATTSYGFTTPDEGGLWLYLGYGVGLGGNWDGVTYNYTVYAFGVNKKAITLSMSITDKAIQPPTPTYTVTFSTNTVAVAEKTLTDVKSGTKLAANQIPDFGEGTWDVQPLGAIITSNTNFNFTVKVDPIPPLPAEPTADDVNAKVDAAKFADSTVKTMIGGDPTKYNAFKTWAGTVTGGEAAVVASAHAADSYLLGQTTLLENAPVSEIKTIAKTSDTALTLTFEIKDGANAVTVAQTAADYVKGLVQCNEKVDFGNGTKIDATVTVTINGQTLTAAVTLPVNKPAAFMKVAK